MSAISIPGRRPSRELARQAVPQYEAEGAESGRSNASINSTGTIWRSTRDASQRPARKPTTTLGSAAMISTVGFTLALIVGCMNCEV